MQVETWFGFCAVALLATATPGPAALLVSVNSVSFGFHKALATVVGNICGLFLMSGLSVLGISALLLHSAWAFSLLKIVGTTYLIYMGVKYWLKGPLNTEYREIKASKSTFALFCQGVIIALSNPKAIVFTTALFPQFIVPTQPLLPQFSLLVVSFMSLSFFCLSTYALLAQKGKHHANTLMQKPVTGKVIGSTFVSAGCYLATTTR